MVGAGIAGPTAAYLLAQAGRAVVTLDDGSAVCNQFGCIVHRDAAEKTCDYPCHGSRFDKLGKVFNGPANQDVARLEGDDSDP